MAAAPQSGFLTLQSAKSGETRQVDLYASDVANALVRFDSGAGASSTSDTFYIMPGDGYLTDFAIHTGMTDTTKTQLMLNSVAQGNIFRYAAYLDTSNARPVQRIFIRGGTKIALTQS